MVRPTVYWKLSVELIFCDTLIKKEFNIPVCKNICHHSYLWHDFMR